MYKLIKKTKEKFGVLSYENQIFDNVWGGITNVRMAKENPFLVVNKYPINYAMLKEGKDQIHSLI